MKESLEQRAYRFLMAYWGLPVEEDRLRDLVEEFAQVEREAKQ